MGTTPIGLPYPEPTDPVAAGAAAIRSLAEALNTRAVPQFATSAARDAAIPAPVIGQMAALQDAGTITRYTRTSTGGLAWLTEAQIERPTGIAMVQHGGQYNQGQLIVAAMPGSSFPSPQISFWDQATGTAASLAWWGPMTRIQANNSAHSGNVYVEATGFVTTGAFAATALPAPFEDVRTQIENSNGEMQWEFDVAELVVRLAQHVAELETTVAELQAASS